MEIKKKSFILIGIFIIILGIIILYPFLSASHLQTLTISGSTTLCGDIANVYDTVVVTSTGVLNICARNATAGTGWVNLTLGTAGNFTVQKGGLINGTARGGAGGAAITGTTATGNATQGENGNNWTVGAAANTPNNGGGGGASRTSTSGSAGGGGGGFGGAGGIGGKGDTAGSGIGQASLIYVPANNLTLLGGSGGGGGAGDGGGVGARGGAGFKVDVGLGKITINGMVNMSGFSGLPDTAADQGAGGGGGGGHIILKAAIMNLTFAIMNVSGGRGGNAAGGGTDDAGGGGGGGGRIYILYSTLENTSATYLATGGVAGTSTGSGGAPTNGIAGLVTFNNTAAVFTDTAPKWFSPSTNNTNPSTGDFVRHNVNWTEDGELSFATLEVNATGTGCATTANVTSMVIIGTSNWSNLTWEIPAACTGKTIGWRIYAKDFPGNITNVTDLQSYQVQAAPADSCTYGGSGNWNVDCAHNCNITSNVALGGNNLTITGTGTFTTEANITNYKNVTIRGTDTLNKCIVRCFKGGCFKAV